MGLNCNKFSVNANAADIEVIPATSALKSSCCALPVRFVNYSRLFLVWKLLNQKKKKRKKEKKKGKEQKMDPQLGIRV